MLFSVSIRFEEAELLSSDALITSTGEAESVTVRSVRRVPITMISSIGAAVVAVACCAKLVAGNANAATLALANNNLLDSLIKSPLGSKLGNRPTRELMFGQATLVTGTL